MSYTIALAGNPNCGKTTMFNALTGSSQYVGNWPGVTIERKGGKLKSDKNVDIMDLPGIYSLSPYSPEEIITRNYLADEKPDAVINIVDASNLERNLYLTTQVLELGIPVVVALNMMDIVNKRGDKVDTAALSAALGVPVMEIVAAQGKGLEETVAQAKAAMKKAVPAKTVRFSPEVETALQKINNAMGGTLSRYYLVKLFERDDKLNISIPANAKSKIEAAIKECEDALDDDSESIITAQRYDYIGNITQKCLVKAPKKLSMSDRIDRIVTNRVLALPIFAAVMFLVYYISVTTVGTLLTDWANDGVFGDGWHLLGIGSNAYEDDLASYVLAEEIIVAAEEGKITFDIVNDNGEVEETLRLTDALVANMRALVEKGEPNPASYGVWVPGIPVIIGGWLEAADTPNWLNSLILDGIIGGVGAILGFVPQMLVLFLLLSFLEYCGYMARIAFIMDRIFRRFGLSGKSFIPILIGTGCGVPGVMASRTIENEKDRKMTVMLTTFIPCGAKLPIIALFGGAVFGGAWWISGSMYLLGVFTIVVSGIILKKTKAFAGDPAPFVMEMPAYHLPKASALLRQMWERGWSFIKKAGTVIFVSCAVIWFLQSFTWGLTYIDSEAALEQRIQAEESGTMISKEERLPTIEDSIIKSLGEIIQPVFVPIGFGDDEDAWKASVATLTGLVAKENVVATFATMYNKQLGDESEGEEIFEEVALSFSLDGTKETASVGGLAFMIFNLLCAPCVAAIGAIRREMASWKWTLFAIGYQTILAYVFAFITFQMGCWIFYGLFGVETVIAFVLILGFLILLFRPAKKYKEPIVAKVTV